MDTFGHLFTILSFERFWPNLMFGVFFGLIAGLVPGISGRIGLLIALPIALGFDPLGAAIFLVAMHAVVHTTGSVPAVLLGLPTSSSEAATVMDGYPMTKQNRGGEAVGATLSASLIGGVVGALALLSLVPFGKLIAQQFGSAEVAALSAAGLLAIAALSGRSVALGLAVASLGVLAASVGLDNLSGSQRYTYGRLELWDGLNIAAVVAGLFVIPEMLRASTASTVAPGVMKVRLGDVLSGCRQTISKAWLSLRCAVLGVVVGFIPGLGASVVVWLAYGHASATTRPAVPFGSGAVEGVIAPEAANNAKEGGALIPTLLFAVPGTSSMGILLGAFALIGIEVGPGLAARDTGFIQSMGWVVLVANLLAFPLCLAIAPFLAHFASLHRGLVVPFALMASTVAALAISASVETLAQIVVFGMLGLLLTQLNWPRAPFVLGFVIGPILESALTRTVLTQGLDALQRPGVLLILAIALAALVLSQRRKRADSMGDGGNPAQNRVFSLLLLLLFLAAAWTAWGMPGQAWLLPLLASACGFLATFWGVTQGFMQQSLLPRVNPAMTLLFGGFIALSALAGPPLAAIAFAVAAFGAIRRVAWFWLPLVACGFGVFAWFLAGEKIGLLHPLTWLQDSIYLVTS